MNLPLDTDRTRCDNPVPMSLLQREVSTVEEVGRAKIILTEPSRCPATEVEVEGTITDTRASIPYRCCDCGIRMTTGHNSVVTKDKDREPRPIRTYPVKAECAPMEGETVLLRPMNFLDVPALRLPGVFLKLAAEARNSEVVDDQPSDMSAVHSQRSGQAGRVMITEIIDSFPCLGSRDSRVSRTSTEVIPDLNLVEPVIRLGPVGRLRDTAQPIMLGAKTNQGKISPPGPVGQHVRMTGRMEMMAKPDPVGPYEEMEQSVYPEFDEGPGEHLPSIQVQSGVEMFHIQPVDDGPAGLVRTRHPVGNVMLPALQDGVRPSAGGPVGQFPDPCFRIRSKNSSPDDSYQPLVTGPLGANVSDALNDTGQPMVGDPLDRPTSLDPMGPREILSLSDGIQSASIRSKNSSPDDSYQPLVTGPLGANVLDASNDTGQPMVGDPVDRPTCLDPMGPREMLSLGDGIQLASIGPVGRPWTTGQLEIQTEEPDYERSTHTRSESESDAESLHSVIRTAGEVYTGRVNTSVATGRTEPSEVLVLSDSVMFSPGAQIHRTEGGSESAAVKPDPAIRTGGEGRTDDMNFDTINGQSGSSVISPSSDSGVHSLDEQWGCMSTDSGNSDSIQSIKTVYGGVVSQADNHLVLLRHMDTYNRGVVLSLQEKYGRHGSMSYLSTNGHNSDIAAMSDFSDEEDEPREEVGPHDDVQPNIRTDWVGNDTLKEVSNSYDYSLLHRIPTEAAPHAPDPYDEDYWTKFRLLTKEAFKLDDVKLSESEYPDAVKALVFRSRWTIMVINERNDVRFEELHDSDDDGDLNLSEYYYRHRLENYRDWHYIDSPIVEGRATDEAYKSVGNADNAEGHDLTLDMEIEDKMDVSSEPDARAKFEVSPTKHVVELDNIRVNCITDGDVTVIRENVAGDSDVHKDEYIKVSMISVDETRRGTSEHIHKSLGIRDYVIAECETQPTLFAYRDSALCNKDSVQIMTKYCFGVCGSTSQFYSTDFEWCMECVDKLIWGFLVSCVVSIVMKCRSVGNDVFIKGSDVFVSIWGLLDGLITPCDAMHECLWRTEDFKDTLNNVMLGNRCKMISHDIPWGEDNGQVRATRASVDIRPIRVRGRFGCLCRPVQGADWLDVRPVDGGPVGMDVWIKYIGDSFSRYQSSDAAPLTEVQDIYIFLHINSDCLAGLYSTRIVSFTLRITRSLEEVLRCGGVLSLCQTMDGAASADDRSGITFTADLCVPWDAPEAVVDMDSPDLISLGPFPDKVGLFGRRQEAAMSRISRPAKFHKGLILKF